MFEVFSIKQEPELDIISDNEGDLQLGVTPENEYINTYNITENITILDSDKTDQKVIILHTFYLFYNQRNFYRFFSIMKVSTTKNVRIVLWLMSKMNHRLTEGKTVMTQKSVLFNVICVRNHTPQSKC